MAVVDPDYERHRQAWIGFTRLMRYALVTIIIVLVGLAYFVL
jgi:Bacterial aa3 type cytochrome c oxidase subunit IV